MDNDKDVPIQFPTSGINVATSFGQQPQNSTPVGVNVRAYESILSRGRGGSRSGLSRYVPGLLPTGDHLVQHMNIVVDPQGGALLAGGELFGPTIEDPDPRWTRLIRAGGSGVQLNANITNAPPTTDQLRQFVTGAFGAGSPSMFTVSLPSQPVSGNLILVVALALTANNGPQASPLPPYPQAGAFDAGGIQNGGGAAYTQVGGSGGYARSSVDVTYAVAAAPGSPPSGYVTTQNFISIGMWYRYSIGNVADQTVTVSSPDVFDPTTEAQKLLQVVVIEYQQVAGSPISSAVNSSGSDTAWSAGNVFLSNLPNDLVVGVCDGCGVTNPPGSFNIDGVNSNNGLRSITSFGNPGFVGDLQKVRGTNLTLSWAPFGADGPSGYAAMAVSFKHS